MERIVKRVVVTGLGCITPIGNTVAELRDSLYAGRTGIAEFSPTFPGALQEDPGLRFRTTGQVKNFVAAQHLNSGVLTVTGIGAQFGIVAARQAAAESALTAHFDPSAIAVITGCSCGGREADEDANRHLYTRNARVHPTAILRTMANSGTSSIAIDLGLHGPALNISTACASGTHAIGLAFQMVRAGMVPAALAGAYEAPLTYGFLRAWDSMRIVSPTHCKPFAADRDGMTLGEGAAMLALEPLDSALARGARIYAEIVGFGSSADAHHIAQPQPEGAALAMRRALADSTGDDAGIDDPLSRLGYINAHGTGTPINDPVEAAAIRLALGSHAVGVPVSATKSLTGHSIGATGAIEALITALALDSALLPHTANIGPVDPAIDLDIIVNAPRPLAPGKDLALSNSLAFGGLNAVIAIRRYVA